MSVEDAIREFSAACERFGVALNAERRFEARLTEDSQESSVQRLLDMKTERCGIRNEIEALSQAVIASLTAQNMPDAALSVSRVVVASWNNVGRWNDVWFECKSQLTTATIVAGREPPAEYVSFKKQFLQWFFDRSDKVLVSRLEGFGIKIHPDDVCTTRHSMRLELSTLAGTELHDGQSRAKKLKEFQARKK